MGVRGEALQRVNHPFPGRDNGQQPARSRFNPPSRPGHRLRECGAGTMDWDQAVAVSLVHQNSVPLVKITSSSHGLRPAGPLRATSHRWNTRCG
jgi:hypothetical protein